MRFFRKTEPEAASPTDLEVIRSKLAECRAEIEAAKAELCRISLGSVLNGDPDNSSDAIDRLRQLCDRQQVLEAALTDGGEDDRAVAALAELGVEEQLELLDPTAVGPGRREQLVGGAPDARRPRRRLAGPHSIEGWPAAHAADQAGSSTCD